MTTVSTVPQTMDLAVYGGQTQTWGFTSPMVVSLAGVAVDITTYRLLLVAKYSKLDTYEQAAFTLDSDVADEIEFVVAASGTYRATLSYEKTEAMLYDVALYYDLFLIDSDAAAPVCLRQGRIFYTAPVATAPEPP